MKALAVNDHEMLLQIALTGLLRGVLIGEAPYAGQKV